MTPEEFESRLNAMNEEELNDYHFHLGGNKRRSIDQIVSQFVSEPGRERKIAHYLGIPTEEEKRTKAMSSTADGVKASAEASERAVDASERAVGAADRAAKALNDALDFAKDWKAEASKAKIAAVVSVICTVVAAVAAVVALFKE